jgi:hypothetical protein
MDAKYQVRRHIANCFKSEASNGRTSQLRRHAAFQYSLCCKIGFGCRLSDEESLKWLHMSDRSARDLDQELVWLKKNTRSRAPILDTDISELTMGLEAGWTDEITQDSLEKTLKIRLREVDDLAKTLGPSDSFILQQRMELVRALLMVDRVDDAETLIMEVLANAALQQKEPDNKSREVLTTNDRSREIIEDRASSKKEGQLELRKPSASDYSQSIRKLLRTIDVLPEELLECIYWFAQVLLAQRKWKDAEVLLFHARNRLYLFRHEELTGTGGYLFVPWPIFRSRDRIWFPLAPVQISPRRGTYIDFELPIASRPNANTTTAFHPSRASTSRNLPYFKPSAWQCISTDSQHKSRLDCSLQ